MRRVLIILCWICLLQVNAQNPVQNYSFEMHSGCPSTQGELVQAVPWKVVNGQTPDYFHPCGLASWYAVPDNSSNFGYQDASEGVAYAGIRAWDNDFGPDIREYIGVSLIVPLTACQGYDISFKVSLADNSRYAIDDLGMYLSNTVINTTTSVLDAYIPQVENTEGNIISDKYTWTTISGHYIAHGGEMFIVIGNFKSFDNTTVISAGSGTHEIAYYYIDEVIIMPDSSAQLELGDNKTICEGQELLLDAGNWDGYTWQDSSTNRTYAADTAGWYHVTAYSGSCAFEDSIYVSVQPTPSLNIGNDTILCNGESLKLIATTGGDCTWNTGSHTGFLFVETPGTYWLEVDTGACIVQDDIVIGFTDCIFVPDIFSPNGDGKNDVLYARGASEKDFEFAIFDRWGQKVFETTDPSFGWDGTFNGKKLDAGIFAYYVKSFLPATQGTYAKKGNVTLKR